MVKGNAKIKEISLLLSSKDDKDNITGIDKLRTFYWPGSVKLAGQLLLNSKSENVIEELRFFFNDIKEKNAIPEIIELIQSPEYKSVQFHLVSSCWQSGLNYTDFFDVFVEIIISEPYLEAFEAFTVIDNCEGNFNSAKCKSLLRKLKTSMSGDDKDLLIKETINLLEQKSK